MKALLVLPLVLLVSFAAFAQNHIDARGREWKRLDQSPRHNSAGALALCPDAVCTGDSTGYNWANADEVLELMRDFDPSAPASGLAQIFSSENFISAMGHTYMFVTTYSYDIGTAGLTSSIDPSSGLPIVGSVDFGHAMVTASGSFNLGAQSDSFRPLFLYKNGQTPPPPPAKLNCAVNGQTILHGASVSLFQSASVAYGQLCQSQIRICNDGVLSGSFTAASCSVLPPVVQPPTQPVCLKYEIKKGQKVCKKYAGQKS